MKLTGDGNSCQENSRFSHGSPLIMKERDVAPW